MRKWMDKEAAKAEGGTPAPRGVRLNEKNEEKSTVLLGKQFQILTTRFV